MCRSYSPELEAGRIREGVYGTVGGDRKGAFLVSCLLTKTTLKIIASDATDWHAAGLPAPAWEHVSVSAERRTPSWKEMSWVKDQFFDPEECVVEFHPPKSKYVNWHPNVLHLWRIVGVDFPLPPQQCV